MVRVPTPGYDAVGGPTALHHVVEEDVQDQRGGEVGDSVDPQEVVQPIERGVGGGEDGELIRAVQEQIHEAGIQLRVHIGEGAHQLVEAGTDGDLGDGRIARSGSPVLGGGLGSEEGGGIDVGARAEEESAGQGEAGRGDDGAWCLRMGAVVGIEPQRGRVQLMSIYCTGSTTHCQYCVETIWTTLVHPIPFAPRRAFAPPEPHRRLRVLVHLQRKTSGRA
jgi:hypothetical protein